MKNKSLIAALVAAVAVTAVALVGMSGTQLQADVLQEAATTIPPTPVITAITYDSSNSTFDKFLVDWEGSTGYSYTFTISTTAQPCDVLESPETSSCLLKTYGYFDTFPLGLPVGLGPQYKAAMFTHINTNKGEIYSAPSNVVTFTLPGFTPPAPPVITDVTLGEVVYEGFIQLDLHFTQDNTDDVWTFTDFISPVGSGPCEPGDVTGTNCNVSGYLDTAHTGGPYVSPNSYVVFEGEEDWQVVMYSRVIFNGTTVYGEPSEPFYFNMYDLLGLEHKSDLESAVDDIALIDTTNLSPQEIESLSTASKLLTDAQGNLSPNGDQRIIWNEDGLDCKFGHVVFDDIKQAVNQLDSINDPAVSAIIADLVQLARDLAQAEINKLPAGAEKDAAQAELDAVDQSQTAMQLVQDYRNIWKSVNAYCDNTPVQTCLANIEVTNGVETINAIGDEVGDVTTWFDPVADPTITDAFSVNTSCNVCLEEGQDLGDGWSISDLSETKKDEGTLASVCGA